MVNSLRVQIESAINDAISSQVLPQIQNSLMAGPGHTTQRGWNVPAERKEINTEVSHGTGRMPSRNHHEAITKPSQPIHQSHDDLNLLLDTTIPAQENTALAAELDPINRLADVLTSMQNRPKAQQLTIRPVNSNTMTFEGKSEKIDLFGDLSHYDQDAA